MPHFREVEESHPAVLEAEELGTSEIDPVSETGASGWPRIRGRVKWYDPIKGFGFVVADERGPDILLHGDVLRSSGWLTVADESVVQIEVQHTERGWQARSVISIDPPETADDKLERIRAFDPALAAKALFEPARMKWFNTGRDYGFGNVWGSLDDVFVHGVVLRRSGLTTLQAGEAIALRVIHDARGHFAVAVAAWDHSPWRQGSAVFSLGS